MLNSQQWIPLSMAARLLGISRQAAHGLYKRGALAGRELPAGKSKRILINRSTIVALIANEQYARLTRRIDREQWLRRHKDVSYASLRTDDQNQMA